MPLEFAPLISGLQKVQKLCPPLESTVESANQEYERQTDSSNAVPSAPVYAARLNGLLKSLSTAETAIGEIITTREILVAGLEKMLQEQRVAIETENSALSQLSARKEEIEAKKQQVELAIMRALGSADSNGSPSHGDEGNMEQEPDRPEMEALTPPAMEEFTPPPLATEILIQSGDTGIQERLQKEHEGAQMTTESHRFSETMTGSKKRRRVDDSGELLDLADDAIDADVAEMLKD